jgi:hypothetical protein
MPLVADWILRPCTAHQDLEGLLKIAKNKLQVKKPRYAFVEASGAHRTPLT